MGLTLRKNEFLCSELLFSTQTDPPTYQFQQFSSRGIVFHFQFLRRLDEKREVATPLIDQFL